MKGRFLRLFLTVIFFFSLIPVTLLQQASNVQATTGWTQSSGMTINDKYILDTCVIKDGATYKMWYTHLTFGISMTALFSDIKALNLNVDHSGNGGMLSALQNHDFNTFLNDLADLNTTTSPTAIWDIINNVRTVIGYATSTDGQNWTVVNSNDVTGTDASFLNSVGFPSVVKAPDGSYKMWYTSLQSTLNQAGLQTIFTNMGSATPSVRRGAFDSLMNSTHTEIDYTTSPDGSTGWSTPVTALAPTGGTWNILNSVGAPSVILDGSTYKMWYTSIKTSFNGTSLYNILNNISSLHMADLTGILNSSALVIGYATDASVGHDGSTFGVVNAQILPDPGITNPGIRQSAAEPCVVKTGSNYDIWYSNGVTNLNAAGLSNVFTAIKNLDIPSLWTSLESGSLGGFLTHLATLSFTGLETALTGTSGVIGHAISTDGVGWTVQNSNEFTGAATTPWSSVGSPTIVKSPTLSEMWFTQGIPALTVQNVINLVTNVTHSISYASISTPAPILNSIVVTPGSPTIQVGATQAFHATGIYSDGSSADITTNVSWSSSAPSVASIDNSGVATGLTAGSGITITATLGITGNAVLNVTAVPLSSILVTAVGAAPAAGLSQQFTATGTYGVGGPSADITNQVTWSSSNLAVASINGTGLATSYTSGTTNITATLSSITSGVYVLNVGAAVLDSISITPFNPQITFISSAAPTVQFTATGIKTDGTTTDLTATATWTSGNIAAANNPVAGLLTTKLNVTTVSTVVTAASGGKSGTSTLTLLPDTVAPVITITNPQTGIYTNNASMAITGSVDDAHATASYILNAGIATSMTLTAGAFNQAVTLNPGVNTIVVNAQDVAGNVSSTGTITVRYDTNKPAIVLTSPIADSTTNNAVVTISGTAANTGTVQVVINGVATSAAVTAGAFSTTGTLVSGDNVICVTGYYTGHSGEPAWLGSSGSIIVHLDTTPPAVTLNSPVNGSTVSTLSATVSGTVDDPAVGTVNVTLNSGAPIPLNVVNNKFSQDIPIVNGANTITVSATDAATNTSTTSPITVTLNTAKPSVEITSPANNSLTRVSSQLVTGMVSGPAIASASIIVNGNSTALLIAPDGTFNKVVTLSSGVNSIEVTANDIASPPNIGSSGVYKIQLDTTPPVLTIGLTDPTSSVGITVTANEALAAPPAVSVGSTAVIMTQSGINEWSGVYGNTGIADGNYTVSVAGTDNAGNSATATAYFTKQSITVDGVNPTAVTSSNTTLQIESTANVTGASVSVTSSQDNPSGVVNNPGGAPLASGVFVEINADAILQNNLNQIYIQVTYDPAKLPSGTDETTLKLYLWDVASGTWQVVPGSGVNTTAKYIYGTVSHLSTYGGFGSATVVTPPVVTPAPSNGNLPAGTTSLTGSILFSGQFINQVIVRSDDSVASITIPANTIGLTSTGLALSQISMVTMTTPPAGPLNKTAVGAIYDFGPNGATFSPGITISIPYTVSQIPAGADASKIKIAFRDASGNWTYLDSVVDTVNHVVTATTTHFTAYALLVPTAPAAFTTSNLTVSPSEAKPGDQVTISVKVSNTGDLSGKYTVTLKVNNEVVDSKEVTLAGGVSSVVTFTNTQSKDGIYSVSIDNQTGQFIVKAPVLTSQVPPTTPVVPAAFTVSNLVITPASIDINGSVNINVQVSNSGDVPGTYEVKLKLDNVDLTSKTVNVASKSTQTVTFTTSEDKAGTYTVSVGGLTGTFTVASASTTTTPKPPPPANNWPLIIGVIGGIIVVAALATVVLVIRRKK